MKKAVSIIMLIFLISIIQGCGGDASTDPFGDSNMDDQGDDNGNTTTPDPDTFSLNSIGNKTVVAGTSLSFTISADNPNSESLVYSSSGSQNNNSNPYSHGASFTPNSRTFEWQTETSDIGNYSVSFSVTNGVDTDSETISISITGEGESLYIQHCQSCHGMEGQCGSRSTVVGQDFVTIKEAIFGNSESELAPIQGMANLQFLSDDNLNSISAYLGTLTVHGNCN